MIVVDLSAADAADAFSLQSPKGGISWWVRLWPARCGGTDAGPAELLPCQTPQAAVLDLFGFVLSQSIAVSAPRWFA